MSELLIGQTSECTIGEFEKILAGFMQAPASPQKVCDKNETKKQRKNIACVKMVLVEGGSLLCACEKLMP